MEQYFIQEMLKNKIEDMKSKRLAASMREVAKIADIHPAALSEFLSGKRNFSKKMTLKLCQNLEFSPMEIKQVELFFQDGNQETVHEIQDSAKLKLDNELYYLLSDPLYYAYLALVETKNFINDDAWASERLSTKVDTVKRIKKTLIDLKLIAEDKKGNIVCTPKNITSSDNIPNSSLKKRHRTNCDDAKMAISSVDVKDRYFAFETLSFKKDDLPVVQAKYNQLLDELIALSQESNAKDEVYEFCLNYFPRTNLRIKS